ncbi:MAG: hypothetical protein RL368_2488 [Pseudomonadota bacterium]|jgi:hypothetical protein
MAFKFLSSGVMSGFTTTMLTKNAYRCCQSQLKWRDYFEIQGILHAYPKRLS